MKNYILDASVILSFLLGQNLAIEKNFTKLLKQTKDKKIKFYSTHLLPLEVGNGLRYSLTDERLATEALESFLGLPINFFPLKAAYYLKILKLSYFLKTSFYDTSYHFLAKLLKGTFLTCDSKYFKKAKKIGSIKLLFT